MESSMKLFQNPLEPWSQVTEWDLLPYDESPEYITDYIAVAAEECSGNYSQGSSSPESHLSTAEDTNVELLNDLPYLNEEAVKEIVEEFDCQDPSFNSVLIDDINNIFNDDTDDNKVLEGSLILDPPHLSSRRKQKIVPIVSQPLKYSRNDHPFDDLLLESNGNNRKRSCDFVSDNKSTKVRVISPILKIEKKEIPFHQKSEDEKLSFKNIHTCEAIDALSFTNSPPVGMSSGVRRKRGLTNDERKERKKLSNRNASYRYRQRKKEELDVFLQDSNEISAALEKEKEEYYKVVEEFLRSIKHAKLVSEVRGLE